MDLFGLIKNLTDPGGDPNLLDNDENLAAYKKNLFVINRGISQSIDTVMFAAEVNKKVITDPEMHYAFMFGSIKKRKRYSAWAKKTDIDADIVLLVQKRYECNRDRALEMIALMNPEQLAVVTGSFEVGGASKPKVVTKPKKAKK